jgi:protocatechuate 4,5-dioxygenase alpha chain
MTVAKEAKEYDDIPGTFVFDADRSRAGYHLNMFCMSLMKDENRKAFKANEEVYLDRFPLTPEQREAILKREYNRMLELGGNIYFTAKLGATDGHSFQHMAAVMTNSTQEDYAKMMLAGGRSVEGNRSKSGRNTGAARSAGPPARKAKPKPTAAKAAASARKAASRKPASRKPVSRKPVSRKATSPKSGSKRG